MTERARRRIPLRRWPTEDWEQTHLGYRFIKSTFQVPVAWTARLRVKGKEHVPREGGVLLAVNHFSWADPILVGASIDRPAHYLAKEALFRNPVMSQFLRALGQVKVDRESGGNEDAVRAALRALEEGLVVGVFPEGTRSRPGQVRRGKTGVARIAALSGAPVVPIGIDTQAFWPRGRALPKLGEKVHVAIGAPMRLDLKPEDAADRDRMRDATDEVMARVRALLAEAVAADREGAEWA